MLRARFGPRSVCLTFVVLALCAGRPAAAQLKINQTSCIPGPGPCLIGAFLQDLTLDCSAGRISTALSGIADRSGPNRITLTGICGGEDTAVVGFNRLTIQGSPGTTITRGFSIVDSRGITLKSLTFDFGAAPGENLALAGAEVLLDGVTVESAVGKHAVDVGGSSQLGFTGAPSLITGNAVTGIDVGAGSVVNVANVTISNNGQQGAGTFERAGITAHNGATVHLLNRINVDGAPMDAPVDISGNAREGIRMLGGTLTTEAEGGSALIHIHDNGGIGLVLAASSAEMNGHLKFDGNATFQIVATVGSYLAIGGAQVLGGLGVIGNSFAILGDGGPFSLTGGATFSLESTGYMVGTNALDALTCDGTSWVFSDGGTAVPGSTCPTDGPTGKGVSGYGIQSTSVTRTLSRGSTSDVTQDCPAGKFVIGGGFSSVDNPNLEVVASGPETTPTSARWRVQVRNGALRTQTGTVSVFAICASASP